MQAEKTHLLFVDDNKDFTEILCDYLSAFEEFIVETANNGYDAIRLITEKEPDVVVLDIVMPDLDGLCVLEKINTINLKKKPHFIIISALGQEKTIQLALSLGADFFIEKPFEIKTLVLRIRQLLALKSNEMIVHSEKPHSAEKNDKANIINLLNQIGMPEHLKGYKYLIYAILMVTEDFSAISSVTKLIYASVAAEYKTTPSRVERAIRNAIEITWCKGNFEMIEPLFAIKFNDSISKPSNSEFITTIVKQVMHK